MRAFPVFSNSCVAFGCVGTSHCCQPGDTTAFVWLHEEASAHMVPGHKIGRLSQCKGLQEAGKQL